MSLKPCRECGERVSEKARNCPKCGIKKPVKKQSQIAVSLWMVFALLILFCAIMPKNNSIKAVQNDAQVQVIEQKNKYAVSQAIKTMPLEQNWKSIEEDQDNTSDKYSFTLHYKRGTDVNPQGAEVDTYLIAKSVLTELMKEGRHPSQETIRVSVAAQQDDLRGETGLPLVLPLGFTIYDPYKDRLEFNPP